MRFVRNPTVVIHREQLQAGRFSYSIASLDAITDTYSINFI